MMSTLSRIGSLAPQSLLPIPAPPLLQRDNITLNPTLKRQGMVGDQVLFQGVANPAGELTTDPLTESLGVLLQRTIHASTTSHPSRPLADRLSFETDSRSLVEHLKSAVEAERAEFVRLRPDDVNTFLKSITSVQVRRTLNHLRDRGLIELNEKKSFGHTQITVFMNTVQKPWPSIEEIIWNRLPLYRRVALDLMYQLDTGALKNGDWIGVRLLLDGQDVPENVRYQALKMVMRQTNRIKQGRQPCQYTSVSTSDSPNSALLGGHSHHYSVNGQGASSPYYSGTKGHGDPPAFEGPTQRLRGKAGSRPVTFESVPGFVVVDAPTKPTDIAPIRWGPTPAIVLYHLLSMPERQQKGYQLPSSVQLNQEYGVDIRAFARAKQTLVKARLLKSPSRLTYTLAKTPEHRTWVRLIDQTLPKPTQWAEAFLGQHRSSLQTEPFRRSWSCLQDFAKSVSTFPAPTKPDDHRNATTLVRDLSNGLVPVVVYQQQGQFLSIKLNPQLNIEALGESLSQLNQQLQTKASAALLGWGLWQTPRLFEPQVLVKPALRLVSTSSGMDPHLNAADPMALQAGLVTTTDDHTFLPLNQLPSGPEVSFDHVTNRALTPGVFNLKAYAQRCFNQLAQVLPMPPLQAMSTQGQLLVTEAQQQQLRRLKTPLETVGYDLAI